MFSCDQARHPLRQSSIGRSYWPAPVGRHIRFGCGPGQQIMQSFGHRPRVFAGMRRQRSSSLEVINPQRDLVETGQRLVDDGRGRVELPRMDRREQVFSGMQRQSPSPAD